jgi:hypothetical protein
MKRDIDIHRPDIVQTLFIAVGVVLVIEGVWSLATGYTLPARTGPARLVKPDEPMKFLLSGIPMLYVGWTWRKLFARFKKRPNQSPEPTAMAVTPPAAQEPRQP